MALTRPKNVIPDPEPAINVAPAEDASVETSAESTATNGTTKDRMPWTAEKVRIVKRAVQATPGVTFDALLATLRAGELAEHLNGAKGRQRLLNLINGIRKAEEQATAEGKEFTPLPEIIMPESMARPNLLEW